MFLARVASPLPPTTVRYSKLGLEPRAGRMLGCRLAGALE